MMSKYYDLIAKRKKVNAEINQEKKRLHNKFVETNRNLMLALDIVVGIIILMNFGALLITNSMVVRTNVVEVEQGVAEQIEYKEANPTIAKRDGFELHPNYAQIIWSFVKQILLWTLLLGIYIYYRRTVYTEEGLFVMLLIITYYFMGMGMDFFNDLGYWLGEVVWR